MATLSLPEALLYLCVGDERRAREARGDSSKTVHLRFQWLTLGLGLPVGRTISEAAQLLKTVVSQPIEADKAPLFDLPGGGDTAEELRALSKYLEAASTPGATVQPGIICALRFERDRLAEMCPPLGRGPLIPEEATLHEISSQSLLVLHEACRFASAEGAPERAVVASIVSGHFWANFDGSLQALEKAPLTGKSGQEVQNFVELALRTRLEVRAAIIDALRNGDIVAVSQAAGTIPTEAWVRWEPDWGLSDLGPVAEPSRYRSIVLRRTEIEGAKAFKGPATPPTNEGRRVGRPSQMEIVRAEHRKRIEAGTAKPVLREQAEDLARWFNKRAPAEGWSGLEWKSIANEIRDQHADARRGV